MSLAKALVMLQQIQSSDEQLDIKRLSKVVRDALQDVEARLKALEAKSPPERR